MLNCLGQAGSQPLPSLAITIGQHVLLSGIARKYNVTLRPAGLFSRSGATYTSTGTGRVLLAVHHYPFCSRQTAPNTCLLLAVTIGQPNAGSSATS